MTKPFRCGGPIALDAPVAPNATLRTRFTPQTRFVVDGCSLQGGWKIVSLRRVGFCELEVGGIVHGMTCKPFTFKPRPDVDLPYHVEPLGDGCVVRPDGADVCISEALEMVVRNERAEPAMFKAWWVGTTEIR